MAYDVIVTREGRWWMIEVPTIDGLTQARRVGEVEEMARDLVAAVLDVPLSTVEVNIRAIRVGEVDALALAQQVREAKEKAERAEQEASEAVSNAAHVLVNEAPTRDVGEILGISHQRVSQLVNH